MNYPTLNCLVGEEADRYAIYFARDKSRHLPKGLKEHLKVCTICKRVLITKAFEMGWLDYEEPEPIKLSWWGKVKEFLRN